ncbi:recombinase family protein [Actinoplanes sp. NPDC020271]|uniref:recombinase family protein n=1 Tax=Actinoplanes sp. NPDC020271 TaxID=3363896 RepID=UPI0037ACCB83
MSFDADDLSAVSPMRARVRPGGGAAKVPRKPAIGGVARPSRMAPMMRIGYARVSTREQNSISQRQLLAEAGCEEIYIDEGVSGKTASRPELDKALARPRLAALMSAVLHTRASGFVSLCVRRPRGADEGAQRWTAPFRSCWHANDGQD